MMTYTYTAVIALFLATISPLVLSAQALATPDRIDIEYPDDEPPEAALVALGKQLFFDKRLSGNNNRSCASCHNPQLGFGDALRASIGVDGKPLQRNSPHLYNLAWGSSFFWDGRADSLEQQATMPISNTSEMNMPIQRLATRLTAIEGYDRQFTELFGRQKIGEEQIGIALAAFLRTLISDNSPFDRFLAGDRAAISNEALRGFNLFRGKASCTGCHDGANLTDDSFHSLGIDDEDIGRGAIADSASLNHRFKTPGLRNVTLTAPYMHDGSMGDLEQVLEFYNDGGGKAAHKDSLIKPLGLGPQDIADLLAFLGALTDPIEITQPKLPADVERKDASKLYSNSE